LFVWPGNLPARVGGFLPGGSPQVSFLGKLELFLPLNRGNSTGVNWLEKVFWRCEVFANGEPSPLNPAHPCQFVTCVLPPPGVSSPQVGFFPARPVRRSGSPQHYRLALRLKDALPLTRITALVFIPGHSASTTDNRKPRCTPVDTHYCACFHPWPQRLDN
jgi:hypothetical protein